MIDRDLELTLHDLAEIHVRHEAPADVREDARLVPLAAPDQRSWLPQSPKWRFQSMFSASKFVVAGAIVALFGGFLLSGVLTQPSDEQLPAVGASASATAEPSPTGSPIDERSAQRLELGPFLPTELPEGTDWGESGSGVPNGQSRWVHIVGDPETLPFMEQVLPGPDGPLLFDTGGGGHPCPTVPERIRVSDPAGGYCRNGPDLWRSADALNWEPLALPVKAQQASLTLVDGTYWLATKDPTELWRSNDAERWEPVDLAALESTGPASLQWAVELGTPVTSNGRTVMPIVYRAVDAGRLLGLEEADLQGKRGGGGLQWTWPKPTETAGRYDVMAEYQLGVEDEGEVLIREDPSGLVFRRLDGSLIARLDGVDLGFVETWSANHQIAEPGMAVVGEAAVVPASVAGVIPPAGPWRAGPPAVLATVDGFRAHLLDDRDGTIATWHSGDAVTWTPGDVVSLDGPVEFLGSDGGVQGPRLYAGGVGFDTLWFTEDGITWEPRGIPGSYLPWGPSDILFRNDRNTLEISVADTTGQMGETDEWYPLVIPGLTWAPEAREPDGSRIATLGDTIFVWMGYRDGLADRHLWVIERWEPTDDD